MILAEMWRHPEFRNKPPRETSLVAAFAGTQDGGTVYCNKVASILDDGSPGVDPQRLQVKYTCEAAELQAFMLIEAIAEKGGVDSSHSCVSIAQGVGGSYKVLLDCLREQNRKRTQN